MRRVEGPIAARPGSWESRRDPQGRARARAGHPNSVAAFKKSPEAVSLQIRRASEVVSADLGAAAVRQLAAALLAMADEIEAEASNHGE